MEELIKEKIIELSKIYYSDEDYKHHILPVIKNALLLGRKLNADLEVVEVAAYLHDIGRVLEKKQFDKGDEKKDSHQITGAEEAQKILTGLGCNAEFTIKVEHCILAHRGSKDPKPETKEAEIIANADAMAHFDSSLVLFTLFFKKTNSFEDAIIKMEKTIDKDWNNKLTLAEAKEMVKNKYGAITLLLQSMKEYLK